MGQQDAQQINAQLPIVGDAAANQYINELGNSIARLTSRGDLAWHFAIVNSPVINAFALPGGYIYVDRGLIQQADRMDQLAGVLGHEIGHVVRRHAVKQMQQMQTAQVGAALACTLTDACQSAAGQSALNVAGAAVFAKFSRQDEKEADDEAIVNVVRAGIQPHGLVEFFQKLLAQQPGQPSLVQQWFASHPTDQARIADVEGRIQQLDQSRLAGMRTDDARFQDFKHHVESLPPPPPGAATQPTG